MLQPPSLSRQDLTVLAGLSGEVEETSVGGSAADVISITSLPGLVQIFGYLKYKYSEGAVLLRGQTQLHATLDPSLYRPSAAFPAVGNRSKRDKLLGDLISSSSPWTCPHEMHRPVHCPEKFTQAE